MKYLLAACAALALTACDGGNSPAVRDALLIVKAQDAVRTRLRDPSSATFSGEHVGRDGVFVCGTVNARNGFGGMSGGERFVAGSVAAVLETDDAAGFAGLWSDVCAR